MANSVFHRLFIRILFPYIIINLVVLPVIGVDNTDDSLLSECKILKDPSFIFAYPLDMSMTFTTSNNRDSYHIIDNKKGVSYYLRSTKNTEQTPLNESALADFRSKTLRNLIRDKKSLIFTNGIGISHEYANLSYSSSTCSDQDTKQMYYGLIISNRQSIISAVLIEPFQFYHTDYGSFTLKSLLTLTPRNTDEPFTAKLSEVNLYIQWDENIAGDIIPITKASRNHNLTDEIFNRWNITSPTFPFLHKWSTKISNITNNSYSRHYG